MYEAFFDLSASPFQPSPDPHFFYWSKGHGEAHAFLDEQAAVGAGVMVLTGEVGAGKTTLARARVAEIDPNAVAVAWIASAQLDVTSLLHAIALAFGLPVRSELKSHILQAIEDFLLDLLSSGRHALLVIDEAQDLTTEALEAVCLLSTYPPGHRSVLQFLLLGQPEMRKHILELPADAGGGRPITTYHLGPMEAPETRAYIEHRLAHVGWQHDPVVTMPAFARIHAITEGIPRRVNSVCNRLLLGAYLARAHEIGGREVDEVAAELRAELGADALPVAEEAVPLNADETNVRRRTDRDRTFMVSSLSARLEGLERDVAHMMLLVRALPEGMRRRAGATFSPPPRNDRSR